MRGVNLAALCGTLALGVVLAGCGSSGTPPKARTDTNTTATTAASAAAQSLPGYLASSSSETIFIEFTNSNGSLSGTVQDAYLSSDGSQVETDSGSISGTVSGSNITLTVSAGVLGNSNISGTLQSSTLVLSVPQSNGELAAVTFEPASVADYNNAVSTLQSSASETAAAQQQAQARQQAAQAAAAAAAQVKSNAEIKAATGPCNAVDGTLYGTPPSLSCNQISYIGTDGSTYYASVGVDVTTGQLEGPMNTDGVGATRQECTTSYYPELSTGPGYGQKGTWNAALQICIPSS